MKRRIYKIFQSEGTASTAKIAIWYVFSNVFVRGISVISTPVFSRLMSKYEYGQFSTFISWESIITILVTLNLYTSIARAKYDFDERMDEYISSILLFSNIVTLFSYCLIELNQSLFVDLLSMDIIYIRMLFIYLIFMPAFTYLQIKHRAYRKYKFFVFFAISSAIMRTAVSILLVLTLDNKLLGRLCGYLIPITMFNMILWFIIVTKGKKLSWTCVKYACGISIPMIPHSLSGSVLGNSDRIMITSFCGNEATALYSIAYSTSMLANLLWTSMNQAWVPWLYDHLHDKNKEAILKKSKMYLGIFTCLIIGVLLVAPEIILVLGGKRYYSARFVMPPVIVGCAFQFIYGMYVNIEIFSKKTYTISVGTMVAALLNLFLNWLFIPQYGYIAAAYTTMVGYGALLLFHYCIVRIKIKEYSDIYEKKFIALITLLIIVCGGVSLILYQYNIIRYLLILLYGVFMLTGLYKYRNYIKSILK